MAARPLRLRKKLSVAGGQWSVDNASAALTCDIERACHSAGPFQLCEAYAHRTTRSGKGLPVEGWIFEPADQMSMLFKRESKFDLFLTTSFFAVCVLILLGSSGTGQRLSLLREVTNPLEQGRVEREAIDGLCSEVVNGLKYCISSDELRFDLGDKVFITTELINVSNDDVLVADFGTVDSLHKIRLLDPNGEIVESKRARGLNNKADEPVPAEELVETLPFGSNRTELRRTLRPNESIVKTYELSAVYRFDTAGTYKLYLDRILHHPPSQSPVKNLGEYARLSVGPVEIKFNEVRP
jgi:hypothetical protein